MALRRSLRRIGALGAAAVTLTATAVSIDVATPIQADAAVLETLTLQANDHDGTMSSTVLQAGLPYEITIVGSYFYTSYGIAGQGASTFGSSIADAECTELRPDSSLQRNRWVWFDPGGDYADVYLEGQNIEWQAVNPDSQGCDASHTYTFSFTPQETKRVEFRVHEGSVIPQSVGGTSFYDPQGFYTDNFGHFTIKISDQSTAAIDTFSVNTSSITGALSNVTLDPDKTYRVQAEGTWLPSGRKQGEQLGLPGVAHIVADAECSSVDGGPASPESPLSTAETFSDTSDDYWDLRVNGEFVTWAPLDGSVTGCDATNTYTHTFSPGAASKLNVAAYDSFMNDNVGEVTVKIFEVPSAATVVTPLPELSLAEQVTVDAASGTGSSNRIPLVAGEAYLIRANGVFGWGSGGADAECSETVLDPGNWLVNRFESISPDRDLLDLGINGNSVVWAATKPNSDGCNLIDHEYQTYYVPASTGTVNFKVITDFPGANFGSFQVSIFHVTELPIGVVSVNTRSPEGSLTPPLLAGHTYRFSTTGTWSWWTGNGSYLADAECSRTDFSGYMENFFASVPGYESFDDMLDLTIGGVHVDWKPINTTSGCDPEHEYTFEMQAPTTGPIRLAVTDDNYGENADGIMVTISKILA